MNHLAIMRQPWYSMIKNRTKPKESRCSVNQNVPYKKIVEDDWIYFKLSSVHFIELKAQAGHVEFYNHNIQDSLRKYQREIGIDEVYILSKAKARYLTLIDLINITPIKAFAFIKHDQRAWITDFKLASLDQFIQVK